MLRSELDRVRSSATAWRNGLGALLAGLIGFGLIKGRSDISGLTPPTAATLVGVLLLSALLVGAAGAWMLLRAAHGRPAVVTFADLPPAPVHEHQEALASARLLRRGIVATLSFTALLVAGLAVTWYGPEKAPQALQVDQSDGVSVCGTVVRAGAGTLVLKTPSGERTVRLDETVGLRPVPSCGPGGQ
ncbi:hypothetical protein [Streptomyces sp. MW-W600-10]|uniref:hypothetical protein n=1 Tax=Streptomyces sp. MW-W600-10 TaxID=2829819 RepID=UPI001C45F19D|nr:hypothetical protein [Streptomyces sp. MW-W600-10]MBV7244041.1 hypothetical protein [Streptomyces sp. MW-W600-10]